MGNRFAILVADRNRNVREFPRREFEADGYSVHLAKDEAELFCFLDGASTPDLVILDLDMPICGGQELLERLLEQSPLLPVVIHTLPTEDIAHTVMQKAAAFLEKRGNNIDHLKAVVAGVLRKCYPNRFASIDVDYAPGLGR